MATLAENAAAVKAAQVAIDAAIALKGGTTTGGLTNAAAAIGALPSGGGDDFLAKYLTKSLTSVDCAAALGYDASTPTVQPFDYFMRDQKSLVTFYGPMIRFSAYIFNGCSALKSVTLNTIGNGTSYFTGCTSLEEVSIREINASVFIGFGNTLSSVPTTCIIHCKDKDVQYVNGAWTIVERS